jgi:hypothetical protein
MQNFNPNHYPTTNNITPVVASFAKAGKSKFDEFAKSETVTGAGKQIEKILKDLVSMASDNKQHFSSLIFTIMDALNYSVVGGLQGLKVELENIVNDEKANSSGESNEGLEFIGECANFIAFFLEYIRINKGLKNTTVGKEKDLDTDGEISKKNIEYLNNAFKHLAYTYGQLSGRTIYYLSKILQSGPVAEVGYFDPISFGSITTTLIKASPVGGVISSVVDTVTNFFYALADAGKSSFKSLEDERKLAGEYMEYINTELGEVDQVGGRVLNDTVETATLNKLHHPKSNKYDKVGSFEYRIEMLINGKKTKHSAHSVELLTGADIQRQITEIETAMNHYNHVSSLVKLLEQLTKSNTDKGIYISDKNYMESNDALEKLIPSETKALHGNETVMKEFGEMLNKFKAFEIESNNQDDSIEGNNIQLYNIVNDFIVNNYELYKEELGDLMTAIGKTATDFETKDDNENNEDKDDNENNVANIKAYVQDKNEKFKETLKKLTDIVKEEKARIREVNRADDEPKSKNPYAYLKDERTKLKTKLTKLNSSKFDDIKSKVSASGNYKKYSSFFKQFKRDMKKEITSLKTTHVDRTKEVAGSDDAQKSTDLINSGLKKILTFIRIKDFGAINNMANQFDGKAIKTIAKLKARKKKYSDELNAKGGGGRRSSIRRRINSATRRIQTTLDSFNSTTRRNVRAKSKPRETRRQHYGH